ncbi:MAG: AMP-binding protein [Sulfitobacter sp.]
MTGLQESLFAFDADRPADSAGSAYIEQFTMRLKGDVDLPVLTQAWKDLFFRQKALRTAFLRDRNGVAVQAVLSQRDPDVRVVDVQSAGGSAALARTERAKGFDLARDALLRVVLMPEEEGTCVMVVTFHHIILDAWSAPTLIDELMALYAQGLGRAGDVPKASPTSPTTLADSQKNRRGDACKAYWRSILDGADVACVPMLDKTASPGKKSAVIRPLSKESAEGMIRFSTQHGVTSSAILHAVWGIVLGRLSDRDDIVFATVMANRSHDLPEIERAIGLFAATLPVRVNWSAQIGFASLCQQMQAQLRDAPIWSALPLAEVLLAGGLRADQLDHTMMGRPASLAWGDAGELSFPQAGLTLCDYSAHSWDHYDFQMGFSLGETPYLEVRHDVMRLPAERVDLLLTLTLNLLDKVLAEPQAAVSLIPICCSETGGAEVRGQAVVHPCARVGSQIADLDAKSVVVADRTVTLDRGALLIRTAQVAEDLSNLGVRAGDRVAISAVQSVEFTVQVLACWQLGAAFVPINPAWPLPRQQQVLASACPRVAYGLPGLVAQDPTMSEDGGGEGRDVAYCVFTSGSTGAPKGVLVPHTALATYCQSVTETFGFSQNDRAIQVTSPAFDLGYTTAFGVLAAGGAVYWVGAEAATDPDLVLRAMADNQITVIKMTPAFLHLLLSTPDPARFADLKYWRLLILGGESPDPKHIARLAELCPWLELVCHYGPTETTIGCAMTHPIKITQWQKEHAPCVGWPAMGAIVRIVDRQGQLMPQGILGEIAIGGAGLALGYLETSDHDGFTEIEGQRFYLTGDLGQIQSDGMLHIAGRRDGMAKIRGHRVDPEETRLALLRLASIEAAAVAIQGQGTQAQMVAFVQTRDGSRSPAALRKALTQHLPEVQIPQRFAFLSRLLMNENGKTDVAAMIAGLADTPFRAPDASAPLSDTEKTLAGIWCRILGADQIMREDDFFMLGGHSLRAIEIAALMERETGFRIPLRWFFDAPVLCDLAARVDAAHPDVGAANAIMRLWGEDPQALMLCLPGLMGSSSIYREWLQWLSPKWSVDGVDDLPPLDAAVDIPATVRWILAQAPDGGRGYRVLLGWSFGADLAFEAAAQLAAQGIAPLVVLIDQLPGEALQNSCDDGNGLEMRRYWSGVMNVLSDTMPKDHLADFQAQFAERERKQRAFMPSVGGQVDTIGILAAHDAATIQHRQDHIARLTTGKIHVLTSAANHFSLFHPPYIQEWTPALRELIDNWLAQGKFEPNAMVTPSTIPPRQFHSKSEIKV